jgi:hypothetical protein
MGPKGRRSRVALGALGRFASLGATIPSSPHRVDHRAVLQAVKARQAAKAAAQARQPSPAAPSRQSAPSAVGPAHIPAATEATSQAATDADADDATPVAPATHEAPTVVSVPAAAETPEVKVAEAAKAVDDIRVLVESLSNGDLTPEQKEKLGKLYDTVRMACTSENVASYTDQVVTILNEGPDQAARQGPGSAKGATGPKGAKGPKGTYQGEVALAYNATYEHARKAWDKDGNSGLSIDSSYNAVRLLNVLASKAATPEDITQLSELYSHVQRMSALPRHYYGALVHVATGMLRTWGSDTPSFQNETINQVRKTLKRVESLSAPQHVLHESFGRAWWMMKTLRRPPAADFGAISDMVKILVKILTAAAKKGASVPNADTPTFAAYDTVLASTEFRQMGEGDNTDALYLAAALDEDVSITDEQRATLRRLSPSFGSRRRAARSRHAYAMSPSTAV